MANMSVIWPSSTPDTSRGGFSVGKALADSLGGPTPLQMLQIDKFKLGMEEMKRRQQLLDAQTSLTTNKAAGEDIANQNALKMRDFASRAAAAEGDAAVGRIPHPPLVLNAADPAIVNYNQTYPAEAAAARARAAYTYGVGDGNPAQRADAANAYAGGTLAQFGTPDQMRRGATMMGHNPGINDYFGTGDSAPFAHAAADSIAHPPAPVMVNGLPYDAVGTPGDRTLKPLAGAPEMPYGTGDKGDMLMSLEKQRIAAGEDPTQVRSDLLKQTLEGQHATRESDSARRDRIVAEANDAIRSGDPQRIAQINPDIYAQAYAQNGYGPKDDFRNGPGGQLLRVQTQSSAPMLITPEQLYQLRGVNAAGAPPPADAADPTKPLPPIIPPSTEPKITPVGPTPPVSLNGEERKSLGTAETLIRPAAYFDKMSPAQIPKGLKPLIAAASAGSPVTMAMISNLVQDPESRAYAQMALNYLNPKLRLDSGATILPPEYAAKWLTDIPMPGDQQQDLVDKRVNRVRTIKAAIGGLPEAALGGYNEIVKQEGYDPNFYAPTAPPGSRAAGPGIPKLEVGQTHDLGNGVTITREAD